MFKDLPKEDQLEIRARRRRNLRERRVMERYQKEGYSIITRGWPCFLARKKGAPARFVWIEKTFGLTKSEQVMVQVFNVLFSDKANHFVVETDNE